MDIQWYPGHMAKAKRLLMEDLKLIDVVAELVDARAPLATRNPDFDGLFANKTRVILLNKADLADPGANRAWIEYCRAQGGYAAAVNASGSRAAKEAMELIARASAPVVERMKLKGVTKVVRAMIVGIPNVGKSTLINRIAGGKRAATGDRPGVTRSKQWVRVTPYLELLDTPGLLWPKLEDQRLARHLAYIGSVKDDILNVEQLSAGLLSELKRLSPGGLQARYAKVLPETPDEGLLTAVALSRGFLMAGGEADTERAARIVLDEFRAGKLGRVTLELPGRTETLEKPYEAK